MLDRLKRPLRDLRISVTDRCNLRCPYCMPREVFGPGFPFMPREELLSFEEIVTVVRAAVAEGVTKVRLTGGEPLLRREIDRLVAMLAAVDGVSDIALTTNGLLLARNAQRLRDAGLDRVTVSLDALDRSALRSMSDADVSPEVILDGIESATRAGLEPVKVNMVVRRGRNDHCVPQMAERFRHRPEIVRFIEFMDVGSTNGWRAAEVVPASEMLAAIGARWPLERVDPCSAGEVATRYRYRDGAGEIGVIHSVSSPFCGDCTRARLSADGKLFTCLFARSGHDLRGLLRSGAGEHELQRRLREIWAGRSDRYSADRAGAREPPQVPPKVEMSYIGG
jgi:cyclic pyranopterin phosphate synthase